MTSHQLFADMCVWLNDYVGPVGMSGFDRNCALIDCTLQLYCTVAEHVIKQIWKKEKVKEAEFV